MHSLGCPNKTKGFSLVELMVGLVIGAFILIGGFKVYSNVAGFFVLQLENLERVQQQKNVTAVIKNSIDHAGYLACIAPQEWMDLKFSGRPVENLVNTPVSGLQADSKAIKARGLQKYGSGKIAPDSDVLIIHGGKLNSHELERAYPIGSEYLSVPVNWLVKKNDYLLASDCLSFYLIEVEKVKKFKNSQLVYFKQPLSFVLTKGMLLSVWQNRAYYVGETTRKHKGEKIRALYFQDTQRRRHELVENITGFTLKYGVINREQKSYDYKSADQVTNWHQVSMVRMQAQFLEKAAGEPVDFLIEGNLQ